MRRPRDGNAARYGILDFSLGSDCPDFGSKTPSSSSELEKAVAELKGIKWFNGSRKIAVPFDSILLEVTGMSELCLKNVVKFAFWVGRLAKLTAVKKSQLLGVGDEYLKVLVSLKPQRSTDVPFEEQELDLLQRNLERVASLGVGNAMLLGPSLRTLEHVPFDSILPEVTGSGELCIITSIELASRISRPAILRYCRRVSFWGSGMSI
ncbi:hypothetical protein LTR56_001335 [Elasticomyces elasticus]|nr:hypothetical protein LTR56_001335 [Elasticomyces elasticus]KAK3667516.1 hypothetical protein LTR22_001694 [Elasticomyces elasticus]KAK5762443.1 hypothetical protein LTS12_007420 [Elasticomyces elasticus]